MNITSPGVLWAISWFFVVCIAGAMSHRRFQEWQFTPTVESDNRSMALGEFVGWISMSVASLIEVSVGIVAMFAIVPPLHVDPPTWADQYVLIGLLALPIIFLGTVVFRSYLYAQRRRR